MVDMKEPIISVVILNWNGRKIIEDCLNSLHNQSYKNYEIIMVDNNSDDDSVEFVRKKFPKVKIIENKKNVGFPRGNNIGVENSNGRYIILLNNDTIVDKNFIHKIVEFATKDKDAKIMGPNIFIPDETKKSQHNEFAKIKVGKKLYTGNHFEFNTVNMFWELVTANEFSNKQKNMSFFTPGCAVIFDRNVIAKPFDDDYFFYGEDTYLNMLGRIMGHDVKYVPDAKVIHLFAKSTRDLSPAKKRRIVKKLEFYGERNRIINILTFYDSYTILKLLPIIVLHALMKVVMLISRGKADIAYTYLLSYLWVLKNWGIILRKRFDIQRKRVISDRNFLKHFSCKMSSSNGVVGNLSNTIAHLYCKFTGIRTVEFYR